MGSVEGCTRFSRLTVGDSTRRNICTVPKQTFISAVAFNALFRMEKSSMPFELQIRLRINDFADEARAVHLRGKDVGNLFRHMFSYIIEFTAIKSSGRSTCETREKICSPNNTHSLSMNASFLRNSNSAASRMENWNQVEVNYYLRDLQLMTEFVASLASIHNESWFTVDWKESVSADVRSRTSSRWNDFALGGSEFWEINGRWLS